MPSFRNVSGRASRDRAPSGSGRNQLGGTSHLGSALHHNPPETLSSPASSSYSLSNDAAGSVARFVPSEAHAAKREPGHIPRPVNAFILFRSHLNATEFAGSNNRELSKVAGERWRAMSDEEKRKFVLGAEVEKAKHAEMYPGYKYTPGSSPRKGKPTPRSPGKSPKKSPRSHRGVGGYDTWSESSSSSRAESPRRAVLYPYRSPTPAASSNSSCSSTPASLGSVRSLPGSDASDFVEDDEEEDVVHITERMPQLSVGDPLTTGKRREMPEITLGALNALSREGSLEPYNIQSNGEYRLNELPPLSSYFPDHLGNPSDFAWPDEDEYGSQWLGPAFESDEASGSMHGRLTTQDRDESAGMFEQWIKYN